MGPTSGRASSLGTRGWNIDPIVDHLNDYSPGYVCDIFVSESELLKRPVDIVFVCKRFDMISIETLQELSRTGVKLIYSIADNTRLGRSKCYLDHPEYMELFDYFKLASPIQLQDVSHYGTPCCWFPTPALNRRFKTEYGQEGPLRVVWSGFKENLGTVEPLFTLIKEVSERTAIPMEVVLNTNLPESHQDGVQVIPWNVATWEDVLISSDIAVVAKNRDDFFEGRKPPTKMLTYMAAGLPTVCSPTAADERIMRHGVTAYSAFTEADRKFYLTELATKPDLRRKMGLIARESVVAQCSIEKISHEHELLFDSVLTQPEGGSG